MNTAANTAIYRARDGAAQGPDRYGDLRKPATHDPEGSVTGSACWRANYDARRPFLETLSESYR